MSAKSPGEVTYNKSAALRQAVALTLLHVAATDAARTLIADIQHHIESCEVRQNRRRAKGREKLTQALAGIIGGILSVSMKTGAMVYRTTDAKSFTGSPVGARTFAACVAALSAARLVMKHPKMQMPQRWGDGTPLAFIGFAPRFEATSVLIALAEAHGVTPETIVADFTSYVSSVAPKVTRPLRLKHFKEYGKRNERFLPIDSLDPTAEKLRGEITAFNSFLALHSFQGCPPPRVYRQFAGALELSDPWTYGGRWWLAGPDSLQRMPEAKRVAILIDAQPCCEIDARASQLSILAGLAGVELPPDPYEFAGVPRAVIKAFMVILTGQGNFPKKWPAKATQKMPELRDYDVASLCAAVATRYPFLQDIPALLEVPKDRAVYRLQYLEADAITRAMSRLKSVDIVSIPIHDSLIIPIHAATLAGEAMRAGYREVCGGEIRLTVMPEQTPL